MLLSLLAPLLLAVCGSGSSPAYSYRYFDAALPLELDPSQVLVHQPGGTADTVRVMLDARPAGRLSIGDVRDWQRAGWVTVAVAPSARDDASVHALIRDLAETDGVELASPLFLDERGNPVVITRRITVGFEPGVPTARREAVARPCGEVIERRASGMDDVWAIGSISRNGFEVLAAANALADEPGVRFAEPDMIFTGIAAEVPDDNLFFRQWALHNTGQEGGVPDFDLDAVETWDITHGDPSIVVAIFDNGVAPDHDDINLIVPGLDLTGQGTDGAPANPCDFHGTPVAGCVAARIGNRGVVGIAPECRVISIKFLDSTVPCNGGGGYLASSFVTGLAYCRDNGIRITNTSYTLTPSASLTNAFNGTHESGLIHFASTGNNGGSTIAYPASIGAVRAVGASNRNGNAAGFSQSGNGLRYLAPGRQIWSTDIPGGPGYNAGDYIRVNGTSYASPYAAGIAALILSVRPGLDPVEIHQIMSATCIDRGDSGYDTTYGAGLLNARAAVLMALNRGDGRYVGARDGESPRLAIHAIEPASVTTLSPGTARELSVSGDAFLYSTTVALDGVALEGNRFGVLDSQRLVIDLPELAIGTHTITLEAAGESATASFEVAPSLAPRLQAGNGNLGDSISSAEGLPLSFGGTPGDVHCLLFSLFGQPSVSPGLVELAIGDDFGQLELGGTFVIPGEGWTAVNLPLHPVAQELFLQTVTFDHGAPIPVSNLQTVSVEP